MTKPIKITLITLVTLVVIIILGYFVTKAVVTSKLEQALKNDLPDTVSLSYEDLSLNLWGGDLLLLNPKLVNKGAYTDAQILEMKLDSLLVNGFGYWDYLKNDKIYVESIQLRTPHIIYNHNKNIPKEAYQTSNEGKFNQVISIGRFNIQNADIQVRDVETDSIILRVEGLTSNVMDVLADEKSVTQSIPFRFGDYNLSAANFMSFLGAYEKITIADAQMSQNNVLVKDLKLFTKYSKSKFDSMLKVERDHFNVYVPSLEIHNQSFGVKQDSLFSFKGPEVILESPQLLIYRNKLIADDLERKDMYSKMLRDLGFSLTLDAISISNAVIEYSEKVNADMVAGKISFSKLNADIKNVSNTYGTSEKTTLDIDAIFMAQTPIKVNWVFDVNDVNDSFVFKADIGRLPAPDLNPFSQPNLKVLLNGELLRTYATISGDANTSQVNMRTKYEDFKVEILDKEAEKKKKVLSAIANLFIKKSSNTSEDGFRESFKEHIERDKTKSIFNFLWLNLKAGLVSVMTGNGKK